MPFVHLKLFGAAASAPDVEPLQRSLTALMATTLRKKRELTVVEVDAAARSHVFVGATPLAAAGWTAQLTAFVTAGTNDADEKAAFQREAHALLQAQFGAPSAPLYIVVQEVPAGDWGYGGLSQAARARAAVPA